MNKPSDETAEEHKAGYETAAVAGVLCAALSIVGALLQIKGMALGLFAAAVVQGALSVLNAVRYHRHTGGWPWRSR